MNYKVSLSRLYEDNFYYRFVFGPMKDNYCTCYQIRENKTDKPDTIICMWHIKLIK